MSLTVTILGIQIGWGSGAVDTSIWQFTSAMHHKAYLVTHSLAVHSTDGSYTKFSILGYSFKSFFSFFSQNGSRDSGPSSPRGSTNSGLPYPRAWPLYRPVETKPRR
ncbi:uncharacterized protein BDW43DRAFT_83127 [Aspergillus alliaceus]|uniref:uncharacterized protein n=1 Tax=Petromyces alliaceus TaxID=209559 RepID=UPI0012A55E0C|nr:uncharacterized protein BDW43DRAFT_83127 [Aspergillus alliaceus]KAB8233643.1 hypothetical protein BDW43DRAFT_83127 [Aspergillus alliaceus]